VLMHNDNYTTMEFVVLMLEAVFHKPAAEAERIMLQVHTNGIGICGVYTAEVAETKICVVHRHAREHGFPLMCTMEPE
jgi:ATP-dependent Clp protease adaptor protein ClpS